jgi:hypothetical protein
MPTSKTNKDLREMLAGALGMIETMLPRVNECYVLSHAMRIALSEINPDARKRLAQAAKQTMNASIEIVAEPSGLSTT